MGHNQLRQREHFGPSAVLRRSLRGAGACAPGVGRRAFAFSCAIGGIPNWATDLNQLRQREHFASEAGLGSWSQMHFGKASDTIVCDSDLLCQVWNSVFFWFFRLANGVHVIHPADAPMLCARLHALFMN